VDGLDPLETMLSLSKSCLDYKPLRMPLFCTFVLFLLDFTSKFSLNLKSSDSLIFKATEDGATEMVSYIAFELFEYTEGSIPVLLKYCSGI
jgi:hypothetical protein